MQVTSKSINYLKNTNKLNFSNFERFNKVLSFLELPFFFDNDSNKFYRFEGSIYNFNYEITYRNFSVDVNLGLKVKTKLLMSLFMQLPSATHKLERKYSSKTSFLLKNGFFSVKLPKTSLKFSRSNDYFSLSNNDALYKKLFNVSMELSDISINLLAPRNKFNRAVELNMFDVDTFISTVNSNWVNINNLDITSYKTSIRSLTVVNDSLRTFSFLISSLDGFKILHPQFFNKYLYFKKSKIFLRSKRIASLFSLVKNNAYYLFFYDNILKTSNNFLIKNLNSLYIYNYVVKFLLFFLFNYKLFNISNIFTLKYLKYILMFISSTFFFETFSLKSLDTRSKFALKQKTLKILQQFIILFGNPKQASLNFNNTLNFFSSISKNSLTRIINVSALLPLNYSKLSSLKFKKCHHRHSLHYQPSVLFSAASRLGYTVTSIAHLTTFSNFRTYHYAEKSITNYYNFLKFFSDFILTFFKRNFVNTILVNNYYNPKYLLFRYFSNVKLFFPLLFKHWFLTNLDTKINDLSLVSNYLNYSLLTKKNNALKYRKNSKYKKALLKSKTIRLSKFVSLKKLNVYNIKSRSYSTLVTDNNFKKLINIFSDNLLHSVKYADYSIFLLNLNKILKFNDFYQSNYFFYLLFCINSYIKIKSKVFLLTNSFFIIDYKLIIFFELLKIKIFSSIFVKKIVYPVLRYVDFNLKLDFYTFVVLNRFVEYFRCFKYNEYLSFNNINNLNLYNHFSKSTEEFYFLPSFFEFKRSLFFNKYLIFKLYNITNLNEKSVNNNFDFFLNMSFFKFFSILLSVKKLLNVFLIYFYTFIISNIYYFGYKALFHSVRALQFIDISSLEKLPYVWKQKSIFFEMISFVSRKNLQQFFLNDFTTFNYNMLASSYNIKVMPTLFTNTLKILLIDYIDNIILSKLLESQSYSSFIFLEFLRIAISRSYFNFIDISYIKEPFYLNIFFLKKKLDFFLWSVYNFAFILNYNSLYLNDINLFINKLTVDKYINKNVNKFSKFIYLCEKSFNISNIFFMYITARDYILKLLSRLFVFSYFYNLYFIYMFLNYFKFLQFYKIKLIFTKLKYYKVFSTFFEPKFNYLIA